jgi:hypothetical protein
MKAILLALLLTGCSVIWPVKHDPAGAQALIQVKQTLSMVECDQPDHWKELLHQSRFLMMYTKFREDPQAKNAEQLDVALNKAADGSRAYCEATLKLNTTRIEVIEKAWSGR